MFPSEMLDEMIAPFFQQPDGSAGFWFTYEASAIEAVAFCAPEPMTDGTWNLYLIAVDPASHSRGIGRALMRHIEALLRQHAVRVLLVETSGLTSFERTRKFYDQCAYQRVARIPEFYARGEDKIIFYKALQP